MSSQPSVSILIAAANAEETLPLALQAIAAQDYQGAIEVVVAVADPGTAAVAERLDVRVVENPSGATPSGLNLAAGASSGDVLIRVDAQSIVPPDYVAKVVASLGETGADNLGGRQVPVGLTFTQKAIAAAMSSRFGAGDASYRIGGRAGSTDTVYLGAFRRELFELLGGYDERFLRNQDYELNQRIRERGGIVWFDPAIEVIYRPRASLRSLARQYFDYGRWKRFFARSHSWSLRPRQWAPPLLVVAILSSLIGAIWWPWLLAVPVVYAVELITVAVVSLRRVGPPALLMPAALAVMHLAWGLGFLLGHTRER